MRLKLTEGAHSAENSRKLVIDEIDVIESPDYAHNYEINYQSRHRAKAASDDDS